MFDSILANYNKDDLNDMDIVSCLIFVLYLCLTIIVLLNLLIAILSSYYGEIESLSDIAGRDTSIKWNKFMLIDENYSILTVFYPPFTALIVPLLPFVFASQEFARKASKVLMYVFYIIFILPFAYCYFLIVEAIIFVPCYFTALISLASTKFWAKFLLMIFFAPI